MHSQHSIKDRDMNLALLDPFRRQVPDRIDSTLTLPRNFHPQRPSEHQTTFSSLNNKNKSKAAAAQSKKRKSRTNSEQEAANVAEEMTNEWHSCFSVAFNRRGNYIAAGHGSGAVPFHDFASRTLSCIYTPTHSILKEGIQQKKPRSDDEDSSDNSSTDNNNDNDIDKDDDQDDDMPSSSEQQRLFQNGITSISWSRRSRRLLIASFNDKHICLLDNTHPYGVRDAFNGLKSSAKGSKGPVEPINISRTNSPVPPNAMDKGDDETGSQAEDDGNSPQKYGSLVNNHTRTSRAGEGKSIDRRSRYVKNMTLQNPSMMFMHKNDVESDEENDVIQQIYYQSLVIRLPKPLGICSQIHPTGNGGLACLEDGSLIVFGAPADAFQKSMYSDSELNREDSDLQVRFVYLSDSSSYHVVHATFDFHGYCIYAGTKCGKLLFFRLNNKFEGAMFRGQSNPYKSQISKYAYMDLKGNTVANQVVLSRNGKMLLLNCKDSLRLYDTNEFCNASPKGDGEIVVKPRLTFQDVVSKSKWHACDFSGDGEYVVGGCNNEESGDKYELYFWNTTTGKLLATPDSGLSQNCINF